MLYQEQVQEQYRRTAGAGVTIAISCKQQQHTHSAPQNRKKQKKKNTPSRTAHKKIFSSFALLAKRLLPDSGYTPLHNLQLLQLLQLLQQLLLLVKILAVHTGRVDTTLGFGLACPTTASLVTVFANWLRAVPVSY